MRPIGDWSISITLSIFSKPISLSYLPDGIRLPFSSLSMALHRVSKINDDLPPPEIPVTQVNVPKGIFKSTFFRLFVFAPVNSKNFPFPLRRIDGTAIYFSPVKYCAVKLFLFFSTSATVPAATTFPPLEPAPGPISTKKSAARMASSSCSTTITVLPISRKRVSVANSLSLSLWCNPMDGSSKTYITPVKPEPICEAKRIRCASPPESVPDWRDIVK